jgi:hypothetical protein
MSASTNTKPIKEDHRKREHRFSKMPFRDVMKVAMKETGVGNVEMQQALGYSKPNVIAMIKSGSMSLPDDKAVVVARVLGLSPAFMLRKLVQENNPALWDAIESVMGDSLVTASELALVNLVRKELDGLDVNLAEHPEFVQTAVPLLRDIAQREMATTQATLERVERERLSRKPS